MLKFFHVQTFENYHNLKKSNGKHVLQYLESNIEECRLTIFTGKNYFTQVNTRFIEIEALMPLTFFICLHNQLSHMKENVCFKKVIHQIDSKTEQLLLLTSSFQLLSTVPPCGKI